MVCTRKNRFLFVWVFLGGGGFAHFLVSDHGAIDTIVLWDIIAFRGLLLADQRLEDLVRLCACESPQ